MTMTEFAVFTPVRSNREDSLRKLLRSLRVPPPTAQSTPSGPAVKAREGPFTSLAGGTHFARFVVIETGGRWCRRPHLLFTSRFDGDVGVYLGALAARSEARAIWEHCKRPAERPLTAEALRHYLLHFRADHAPPSYVVSACPPSATVAGINAALELRAELSRFATDAGQLDATALTHAFRELDAIRQIGPR